MTKLNKKINFKIPVNEMSRVNNVLTSVHHGDLRITGTGYFFPDETDSRKRFDYDIDGIYLDDCDKNLLPVFRLLGDTECKEILPICGPIEHFITWLFKAEIAAAERVPQTMALTTSKHFMEDQIIGAL